MAEINGSIVMTATLKDEATPKLESLNAELAKQKEALGVINKATKDYERYLSAINKTLAVDKTLTQDAVDALLKEKEAIEAEIKAYKEKSIAQRDVVAELEKQVAAAKKNGEANASLRTRIKEMREEMAQLAMEGKKSSARYTELANQIGVLQDAYADTGNAMRNMASDTQELDAALAGLSVGADAMEVTVGAMGMFGKASEQAAEMQTKLQSAMALANGVKSIQNALQKESVLRLKLNNIQMTYANQKELISNKAKAKNIVLTKTQIALQAALNTVMKANPIMLIVSGVAALVGALSLLAAANKRALKSQQELNAVELINLDILERQNNINREASDKTIKALQTELSIAKERTNNTKEVRDIEDKIAKERRRANQDEIKQNKEIVSGLEKNRKELEANNRELDKIKKAKAEGDTTIKLKIDGKVRKYDIDQAIEYAQGVVDKYDKKVEIGTRIVEEKEAIDAEEKARAERRRQEDIERRKSQYKAELDILRAQQDNELALKKDGYDKEDKIRKANYDKKIKDLKDRLKLESATLTKAAKESLELQIKQQEELYKNEQQLENEKRRRDELNRRDSLMAKYRSLDNESPEARRRNLYEDYMDEKRRLERERNSGNTSIERKKEIEQELEFIHEKYIRDARALNDELKKMELDNVAELVQLKIDANESGNSRLLELHEQLLDAEKTAEIAAIKSRADLSEQEINERIALIESKFKHIKESGLADLRLDKINELSNGINELGGIIDELGNISNNEILRGIGGIVNNLGKIASGIEKGNDGKLKFASMTLTGLLVEGVVGFAKYGLGLADLADKSVRVATSIDMLRQSLDEAAYSNAFGTDEFKKAFDALSLYIRNSSDANMWRLYGNDGGSTSSIANAKIKGSGFLWMFRDTLSELAPWAFDENGNLTRDLELLKKLREEYGELIAANDEAALETLDNIVKYEEQAKESLEAYNQYLQDMFGGLSDALMTDIVEAVEGGTRAWDKFEDAGKRALENILRSTAYSTFIQGILDELNAELESINPDGMSPEGIFGRITEIYDRYYPKLLDAGEQATDFIKLMNDRYGLDLYNNNPSSMAGAIQTVTEQTASIIQGQMNAIRVNQINANDMMRQQLLLMNGIKADTAYLSSIDRRLARIESNNDNSNYQARLS